MVYNRDFVDANYNSRLAGIFTLGDENKDALARIDQLSLDIQRFEEDVANRQATLNGPDGISGKQGELRALRAMLEEECWALKTKHDPHFQEAFAGFRGAKPAFCEKILREKESNRAELCELDDLQRRVATVFEKGLQPERLLAAISGELFGTQETAAILAKRVIGKDDVDVASLIRKLGNSDWVKQGLTYLPHSEGDCPFCQQKLPHDIEGRIGEYFDETYAADIREIEGVIGRYEEAALSATRAAEGLIASEHRYLEKEALKLVLERLVERVEANKRKLEAKKKEPSAVATLESTLPLFSEMANIISKANVAAEAQNQLLANINAERATLVSQIWRYVVHEADEAIRRFSDASRDVDAAISGLQGSIAQKRSELATARSELQELERSITSVVPTVIEINRLLASFGFRGFSLATAGDGESQYQVLRPDGADATLTLSEGEKTFITFLYFYHLLRGSASQSGVTTQRVVVIDDPVSSLDSDILFIVSSLIKRVLNEACEGTGLIKQVILLTHNIYFHKEVTFDPRRGEECRHHETFWIVKKRDDVSILESHNRNPIRTSYELLWAEVRGPHRSNLTIQNTLRRILENYFTILGNIDRDTIIENFEGQDRMICGALFSWVNDGSHSAHDDLYLACDDETVGKFLTVFRQIFKRSGHEAHYWMMMGNAEPEAEPPPAEAMIVAVAAGNDEGG